MLKYVEAKYPEQATGASEGELAESFEISPDKLTLTFKLRQGMNWDPREPTNGRAADAQDVLTTWSRFLELHPGAGDMASQRASSASIESVSAPDAQTVVFTLSKPDSAIIPLFTAWDHLYVMPREADGGFDPNTEVRGHGPYMLEEFIPSSRVVWTKAPGYYQKDRPFFDKIERPLITDYSQLLAQFLTGAVWTTVVTQEDVVPTKKDKPDTLLLQSDAYDHAAGPYISFGFEGDSVFKDKRMRQAISMSLDSEAYANAVDNRDKFEAEGLEFPIAYNSVVPAGWMPFWLDPQDTDAFGPSSAYLQYNPEEAKKLMDAAGYDGRPLDFFYNSENNYGPIYAKIVQIVGGMFSNAGFNINYQPFVYRTFYDEYFLAYVAGRKEQPGFTGLMLRAGRGHASIAAQLFGGLHPDGSTFHGLSPDGNNAIAGDPEVTAFVEDLRLEYDLEGQIAIVNDLIRYYTDQSYSVTRPTNAREFYLYWPVIGNVGAYNSFRGGNIQAEVNIHWWLDATKAPLA
jgi:ABC-type transport system substrate-binding protein